MGNSIRVELFCVCLEQLAGARYFVGVKEFSDCEPIPECERFEKPGGQRRRRKAGARARASASPPGDTTSSDPDSTGESIVSSNSDDSDAAGPEAQTTTMLETSDEAIHLALVHLMRLMSLASPMGSACCPFHSRIARLRRGLRNLNMRGCVARFKAHRALQCEFCGLLALAEAAEADSAQGCSARCFACEAVVSAEGAGSATLIPL
mmetsp:Transcript_104771/g.303227  ORF Transcript_104771/g.303227 Transcript_104771/m.303227 type:complete len:207 (+) Transcript_104771:283-903(+)